jgi:tetratricopeptide (TPR) repeat protein
MPDRFHSSTSIKALFLLAWLGGLAMPKCSAPNPPDVSFAARVESARIARDEGQLNVLKAEFEKLAAGNACDARCYYQFALTLAYLTDVYDLKKDKKQAQGMIDRAIEAALHSAQLDDKSADTHALLADLYGRRIGYGAAMFLGPKYGPKTKDEVAKAIALDGKNPRVWASDGRKFLMAPKMFGGDPAKAIESFKKSLELDAEQAETWAWLAQAYKKQGDKTQTNEAIQKALQLEPQNPLIKWMAGEVSR